MDLPVLKMTTTNLSYCITGIIEPVPFANAILHQDAGLGGREAEVGSHKFPDTAGFSSLQMLLDVHVAFFHKSAAAWNSFST